MDITHNQILLLYRYSKNYHMFNIIHDERGYHSISQEESDKTKLFQMGLLHYGDGSTGCISPKGYKLLDSIKKLSNLIIQEG